MMYEPRMGDVQVAKIYIKLFVTLETGNFRLDCEMLRLKPYEIRHIALRELGWYVGGMP